MKPTEKISRALTALGIKYRYHWYAADVPTNRGAGVYFHFALFHNLSDELPYCLIEYRSIAHFDESAAFTTVGRNDDAKRRWAASNGIQLIEVPYWDLDHISSVYLKEKIRV